MKCSQTSHGRSSSQPEDFLSMDDGYKRQAFWKLQLLKLCEILKFAGWLQPPKGMRCYLGDSESIRSLTASWRCALRCDWSGASSRLPRRSRASITSHCWLL